ncbi:hypothetical protein [Microbacterium sp. gxy059]|uniref:hypothetical protein n=1 Tax=Microbacterium sp. gxy059 TaxID=2957199 RepID=UPI003D96CA35
MGLFDRAKKAAGDAAAQAQAAQRLAAEQMAQAGWTDGSLPTMATAPAVGAQMQADHDELNAYGRELNRIIAVGAPGESVIVQATDTGERTAGNAWFLLEVEVTLPGEAPYTVRKREMVPAQFVANYAAGSAHAVAVDPADRQRIAFTS